MIYHSDMKQELIKILSGISDNPSKTIEDLEMYIIVKQREAVEDYIQVQILSNSK